MASHHFGFDLEIEGDGIAEKDFQITGATESIDVAQITAAVVDANDNDIVPNAGILRVWIKPIGSTIFLEGDQDLNLTEGEFYRPFASKIIAIKAEVIGIDPPDATTFITIQEV